MGMREEKLAGELRDFYKGSQAYLDRGLRGHGREFFAAYHSRVGDFVAPGASILEVGCGTGVSCGLLAGSGYLMTGTDLSERFLDHSLESGRVKLMSADASALPFPDGSFDAVISHQFIEHVAEPGKVLAEMGRVVKPGGTVLLMSPNLLSPFIPGSALKSLLRGGRGVDVWGESVRSAMWNMLSNLFFSFAKAGGVARGFMMRKPDFTRPGVSDADASYLSTPLDIIRFYRRAGFAVRDASGRHSKLEKLVCRVFPPFSAEICVIARKPGGVK
jgi:SAM-dependent methyltransferase